jgi:SpoVK/Ycf46/Vps4 family AAA+-type ATPase
MYLIATKEDYEASVVVAGRTSEVDAIREADRLAERLDDVICVYVTEVPDRNFNGNGCLRDVYSTRGKTPTEKFLG